MAKGNKQEAQQGFEQGICAPASDKSSIEAVLYKRLVCMRISSVGFRVLLVSSVRNRTSATLYFG
jgi:hypothetical protein